MLTAIGPDDSVWLNGDGNPGIVIGVKHNLISILWPNGAVSRHKTQEIFHAEPFTSKELP